MFVFFTIILELLGVVAKNPIVQKLALFTFFFGLLSYTVDFFVDKVRDQLVNFSDILVLASYLGFLNALSVVFTFLITGFPGSGKTYNSVKKIFDIIDSGNIKFDYIYTNINGFKYDKHTKLKKFNEDEFYLFLVELFEIYNEHKVKDDVDEHLISFCKQKNYFNCYFVFDECHNFFSLKDDAKIFWLTYHRHLFHEIDLITQNKTLINTKYRGVIEIFINSEPISKKVFPDTLVYKKYSSFIMRKADLFDKEILKIKNNVFALYKSGNISKQKSILVKYFKIILLGLFLIIVLFMYLFNSLTVDEPLSTINDVSPKIDNRIVKKSNKIIKKDNIEIFNNKVIQFFCETSVGCTYDDINYPISYIRKFIRISKSSELLTTQIYYNKKLKYRVFKMLIRTNQNSINDFFLTNTDDTFKVNTINKEKLNTSP